MSQPDHPILGLLKSRWERFGFDHLLQEEKDYILVWWLDSEASNGSLDQYFWNPAGDSAEQAVFALKRLGAHHVRRVLSKAMAAFGEAGYPANRTERQQRLDATPDRNELFGDLTDDLYKGSVDVIGRAIDRVSRAYREHGITHTDQDGT